MRWLCLTALSLACLVACCVDAGDSMFCNAICLIWNVPSCDCKGNTMNQWNRRRRRDVSCDTILREIVDIEIKKNPDLIGNKSSSEESNEDHDVCEILCLIWNVPSCCCSGGTIDQWWCNKGRQAGCETRLAEILSIETQKAKDGR